MRYDNPELQHRLAAEYVLGTLQGPARRRFESLLALDEGLRRRVGAWEARLSPWAVAATPVPVPERVWAGIRQRLGQGVPARNGWRGRALASMAAAAALAAVLVFRPAPAPPALHDVAVLSTDKAVPTWIVRASSDGRHLALSGLLPAAVPSGRDLELWAIPAQGAPQSLGVLQRTVDGDATLDLDTVRRARLAGAVVLAVSLEPAGGSPTGAPSGPVLYTGRRAG